MNEELLSRLKSYIANLEPHQKEHIRGRLLIEAYEALRNEDARGIHTCHDQCTRPLCVLRRRVRELEAEVKVLKDADEAERGREMEG